MRLALRWRCGGRRRLLGADGSRRGGGAGERRGAKGIGSSAVADTRPDAAAGVAGVPAVGEVAAGVPPRFAHHLAAGLPAEHWRHLRTTNPIESSFATVKLRTKVTKGAGSKKAALAMAYKLLDAAQERWRRFNGHELVGDVLDGVKFKDGIKVTDDDNDDNEMTDERVAA